MATNNASKTTNQQLAAVVSSYGSTVTDQPEWVDIDVSVKRDMTAWRCGKCDAVGTGWPPEPIFCSDAECPARMVGVKR